MSEATIDNDDEDLRQTQPFRIARAFAQSLEGDARDRPPGDELASAVSFDDAVARGLHGRVTGVHQHEGYSDAFRLTDARGEHVWVRLETPEPGFSALEPGDHVSLSEQGSVVRTARQVELAPDHARAVDAPEQARGPQPQQEHAQPPSATRPAAEERQAVPPPPKPSTRNEGPDHESFAALLRKKPNAWMLQTGGLAKLSRSQRASAQRSYQQWSHREKWSFVDYVAYVQERWRERRERAATAAREVAAAREEIPDERRAAAMDPPAHDEPAGRSDHNSSLPEHQHDETVHVVDDAELREELETHHHNATRARLDDHLLAEPTRPAIPLPPPTRTDVVGTATERLKQLLAVAKATRERDAAAYKAKGLPEYPRDSPRRRSIEHAAAAPMRTGRARDAATLKTLDNLTRQVAKQVVDNPLWIAADYVERHTKLERVDLNLDADARVREARGNYRKLERDVLAAKREQEAFRDAPTWKRAAANLLGDRDKQLHEQRMRTSAALVDAKQALDALESDVRNELELDVAARNADATARKEDAITQRDALEQSVRDALLERTIAELALTSTITSLHLKNAQEGEHLEYGGQQQLGGDFSAEVFTNTKDGRLYVADTHQMREVVERLDLSPGDRLECRLDQGRPALHRDRAERAIEHVIQPGELTQIAEISRWKDGNVLAIKVDAPNNGRWISRGDLDRDFTTNTIQLLCVGDEISFRPEHGAALERPQLLIQERGMPGRGLA